MRKIIILSFVTLDGVMQAPGGPGEDRSGGFKHGGWTVPYFDDFSGRIMAEQMSRPFDLLLGRKTYEIFASYWPHHNDEADPVAAGINRATKYVASRTLKRLDWDPSVLIKRNTGSEVRKLKGQDGPDLQVHGSGNLIQTLFQHDLVDTLRIWQFPVVLGTGKRLFGGGTIPRSFRLVDTQLNTTGAVLHVYERADGLKYGEVEVGQETVIFD